MALVRGRLWVGHEMTASIGGNELRVGDRMPGRLICPTAVSRHRGR